MVTHNRHPQSSNRLLAELTTLYGVQTAYRDSRGRWCESPIDSVVKVLRALGAELGDGKVADDARPGDAGGGGRRLTAAIRVRKRELEGRLVEPVLVAWDGVLTPIPIRPGSPDRSGPNGARLKLTLTLEDGAVEQWESPSGAARGVPPGAASGAAPGAATVRRGRRLPPLPYGYHRLLVETGGSVAEATVISAPRRCWTSELGLGSPRKWGVFAPLYAFRSERNWGAGDLADLGMIREWVADGGGSAVATLPLLAAFLDRPFEPAPYRPVSRVFWNEFYLAVDQIAEWDRCAAARELWAAADTQTQVRALRAEPRVDYRAVMALKRRVLEELSRCFFSGADAGRMQAFSAYVRAHPDVKEYAAFRARAEITGTDWRSWPDGLRAGRTPGKTPARTLEAKQYHLYCQWQMDEQLGRLSAREARAERGRPSPGLFLDLPLGVHPGGFDTWRWPGLFATAMSTGAPSDSFFAQGQDWDSPPLHPERIREQGHQYFARCIRDHMRHAEYLRIDHVMSLHRLFWVPEGTRPADGAYVAYPADELYAVLCLESHRNQTVIVGEDLGTVPAGVRSSMRRHGVLGIWVFQASLRPRAAGPASPVPRHVVAGLNTHDMFPFAGFLRGDDITARMETGQLDREGARREMAARHRLVARLVELLPPAVDGTGGPSTQLLFRALAYLAGGQADLVLVNLEDLLLETRPQNLPGTGAEWGNWRRKAAGSEADVQLAIAAVAQRLVAAWKRQV
jgi:4-alpha-glucanotransferase